MNRIAQLDALRGLAVLGILLCNIPLAAEPMAVATSLTAWPHGTAPGSVAVWIATQVFFQQKFYSLFSMLFGASILLVGGEGGDGERTSILVRRLLSLLIIGVVHGALLWNGDVLTYYAVVGLVVALARSWPAWRLLAAGVALDLAMSIVTGAGLLTKAPAAHPSTAELAAHAQAQAQASARYAGTFLESLGQNFHDYHVVMFSVWTHVPAHWPTTVAALMLMGMGLFKLGLLSGRARPVVYKILAVGGLAALALSALPWIGYAASPDHPAGLRDLARWSQRLTAALVSLGYAGLLILAATSKTWKAIPGALAPVGQMAFTNYLAQSAIMTAIFYGGRGPGLYGRLDRPALAAIVVAVWVAQILWSRWWMDRFAMGPLEWLWRRLYRGPAPLRRAASTGAG